MQAVALPAHNGMQSLLSWRKNLSEQRTKPRLLEMSVTGHRVCEAFVLHHEKRDAVRKRPIFVGALTE
jgi:hypothetical protein